MVSVQTHKDPSRSDGWRTFKVNRGCEAGRYGYAGCDTSGGAGSQGVTTVYRPSPKCGSHLRLGRSSPGDTLSAQAGRRSWHSGPCVASSHLGIVCVGLAARELVRAGLVPFPRFRRVL